MPRPRHKVKEKTEEEINAQEYEVKMTITGAQYREILETLAPLPRTMWIITLIQDNMKLKG